MQWSLDDGQKLYTLRKECCHALIDRSHIGCWMAEVSCKGLVLSRHIFESLEDAQEWSLRQMELRLQKMAKAVTVHE